MIVTDHSDNFPREFFRCPECGKKGVYETKLYERCKYCGWEHHFRRSDNEHIARNLSAKEPPPKPKKPKPEIQIGSVVSHKITPEYGVVIGKEKDGYLRVRVAAGYGRKEPYDTVFHPDNLRLIARPNRIQSNIVRKKVLEVLMDFNRTGR